MNNLTGSLVAMSVFAFSSWHHCLLQAGSSPARGMEIWLRFTDILRTYEGQIILRKSGDLSSPEQELYEIQMWKHSQAFIPGRFWWTCSDSVGTWWAWEPTFLRSSQELIFWVARLEAVQNPLNKRATAVSSRESKLSKDSAEGRGWGGVGCMCVFIFLRELPSWRTLYSGYNCSPLIERLVM